MKRILPIFVVFAFLACATGSFAANQVIDSYRCSTKLFKKGDQDFEVEKSCGAPVSRDLVGYTDANGMKLKIEKWVYGPTNGKMYILYFKAGILERIESYRP